jgi:hypothetical protein
MYRSLIGGGVVVASIFVALLICEGLLRILGVSYPVFHEFDETRGVRLKPGKQGWYRTEGEAYLHINSLGYRDREHARVKPANTVRIAVLGDSFVEARQVALENTFWDRLGRKLQVCDAFNGKQIEVLSFGIAGYNTSQEYLTLQEDVLDFSPDIVLLAMFPSNDIPGNSPNFKVTVAWRMPAPTHAIVNDQPILDTSFSRSIWRRMLYEMAHYSRVVELINEARRRVQAQLSRSSAPDEVEVGATSYVYRQPESREWQNAWLVTESLLKKMNDLIRSKGARFVVTTIPSGEQVDPTKHRTEELASRIGVDNLFYPDERITAIGSRLGFEVYALTRELQDITQRDKIYVHGFENTQLGFGHLNEAGHALVAQVLATKICNSTRSTPMGTSAGSGAAEHGGRPSGAS